jgi:hypothetical protein
METPKIWIIVERLKPMRHTDNNRFEKTFTRRFNKKENIRNFC